MLIQRIKIPSPFNLGHTVGCGQVFRWRRINQWWYRVIGDSVVKIRQVGDYLELNGSYGADWTHELWQYFRLDDMLEEILVDIGRDKLISDAVRKYDGLRLIRQDPWECLLSYICATNSNIPKIEMTIENLCKSLGRQVVFEGAVYYTFPTPEAIADADISTIRACKAGYRSEFIRETAKVVSRDKFIFKTLYNLPYEEARKELLRKFSGHKVFKGIGPKAADCILLFSLDKLEAFPIDVWMLKTVLGNYEPLFGRDFIERLENRKSKTSLGLRDYSVISRAMREYFRRFAGYAQQYLYYSARRASILAQT